MHGLTLANGQNIKKLWQKSFKLGLSALIIGYGSIGKKHAEILNSLEFFSNIYVLTSQK